MARGRTHTRSSATARRPSSHWPASSSPAASFARPPRPEPGSRRVRAILPVVLATKDLMTAEPGVWVEGPDGELVPDYESTFPEINEGEVVHGTVVRVDKDEVLVDIGYKSEVVSPVAQLSIRRSVNPADEVAPGHETDRV